MNIIKKASIEAVTSEQDAQELVQPNVTIGFETCQDIQTIKEELSRLGAILDGKTACTAFEMNVAPSRYWAIRWVMGWEKEVPE